MGKSNTNLVPVERIEGRILIIRNEKVMLDSDLADLYEVESKYLIRSMKRNKARFPGDFMFQLTPEEFKILRCQFGTSSLSRWGGRRYPPYAFTEHGVAMLSGILNSPRAIQVNIEIMRAFTRLRKMLATHSDLEKKIHELEKKYDSQFRVVFEAIRELMSPSDPSSKGKIGYASELGKS
jgi:phage regulator Rha-like protein